VNACSPVRAPAPIGVAAAPAAERACAPAHLSGHQSR
jgi:hypothetical protein